MNINSNNINYYNSNIFLSDFLNQLTNLSILTFGDNFNQPLSNFLDQLTNLYVLTLGLNYNQNIDLS